MSTITVVLHVLGASLWIGGLVAVLISYRDMSKSGLRKIALTSTLGLLLILVTGILNAGKYGDPNAWFQMGTTPGRVGEKIISWIVAAVTGGYAFHKLSGQASASRVQAMLVIALIASLGALALGVMLVRGA